MRGTYAHLFIVCCLVAVSKCDNATPTASSAAIQPRTLSADPHAAKQQRLQSRRSPQDFLPAYDRFLSRNTRLNEELESMFKAWDSNADGQLSQHEVNLLCEREVISPTEYDLLMSFDVDDSGAVDHNEFKMGPLFVNVLEHDSARNEAFEKATAAKHSSPRSASPLDTSTRLSEEKLEPLGQHVLDARHFYRERLQFDRHPLTASSLPLSTLSSSSVSPSSASSLPSSSPLTPAPILLSLHESVSHKHAATRLNVQPQLDALVLPPLRTTPDVTLNSLLQRVDSSVDQTLRHSQQHSNGDMSSVSFEAPTIDNLDNWVDKAHDIMYKLKNKKIGQQIEEAIPQTKFIEESWKLSAAHAQQEAQRLRHEQEERTMHEQQRRRAAAAAAAAEHERVQQHRRAHRSREGPPTNNVELELHSEQEGEVRAGSRVAHVVERRGRGDNGHVIGKEYYSPADHVPASSAADLRAQRMARQAAEEQAANQASRAQDFLHQHGVISSDSLPSSAAMADETTSPTTLLQQDRSQIEASTQTEEQQQQQDQWAHTPRVYDDVASNLEAEPRLQQSKQINLGGSASLSFGAQGSLGAKASGAAKGVASAAASIGASASIGGSASFGAKASIGGSASIGAKASVGAKATTTPAAKPAVKPAVKITLKPPTSTGDGLPVSQFGVPSYDDERCVLCQYLVQRMETNLYHRMLILLDAERQAALFGTGTIRPSVPQPPLDSSTGEAGSEDFTTTTAPGGGATGTAGMIWDVLSRAYSGSAALNMRSANGDDMGLWMDPTDPNNQSENQEPLSDYAMKEVNHRVTEYTDGRGHGIVRYTCEDTLSDFCAEDSLPELFYGYCPDFWSALPTIVDAIYFGFHADGTCEEAQMCGITTYFNTQNAVHLPNKSRFYNAGRGVCGLTGGSRERKRGGTLLSFTCNLSKTLGKW